MAGTCGFTVSSLQEPERAGIVTHPNPDNTIGVGNLAVMSGPRGRHQCGQATKGMWGMSGRRQAMKGVEDCDKPGEAVKRALRPGSPNDRRLNP